MPEIDSGRKSSANQKHFRQEKTYCNRLFLSLNHTLACLPGGAHKWGRNNKLWGKHEPVAQKAAGTEKAGKNKSVYPGLWQTR